jgi:hypothetical protein
VKIGGKVKVTAIRYGTSQNIFDGPFIVEKIEGESPTSLDDGTGVSASSVIISEGTSVQFEPLKPESLVKMEKQMNAMGWYRRKPRTKKKTV